MTVSDKVDLINNYITNVYIKEIVKMGDASKGDVAVYQNGGHYIENLQIGTQENYSFDGTSCHFNEIVGTVYTGISNTFVNNVNAILIAIDDIYSNTISFYEVLEDDFVEIWDQMNRDAKERLPGWDAGDDPYYPPIMVDHFLKKEIGNMVDFSTLYLRELNGFEKVV